jgi:type VII secretion protein EccB
MASRSDQLHSHQFTLQRVIGALATRDPDPASSPMRRIGGAVFGGVMVAVLALAAVGVYGVLRPGGKDTWRDGKSVIIEDESGARFVYTGGVLHPVLNYASALLLLGSQQPGTVHVSRDSLKGTPRGALLGIPGAPDALPAPGDLVTDPWSLCSRPARTGGGAESVLLVGAQPTAPTVPLGSKAIYAKDPAGGLHLIVNDHRYPVRATDVDTVVTALNLAGKNPVAVAPAVLNSIAVGRDLSRISLPWGNKSTVEGSSQVGRVYYTQTQNGGRQYGVAMPDGLAPITQLQADLILADPNAAQAGIGEATKLDPSVFSAEPRAASLIPTGDAPPPETTPGLYEPTGSAGLCVEVGQGSGAAQVLTASSLQPGVGEVAGASPAGSPAAADWIAVAPGRGAVVEALASADSPDGALSLVTDLGVRYPVPSMTVLATLGFSGVTPVRLPAALVALLPVGRALDPAAAGAVTPLGS